MPKYPQTGLLKEKSEIRRQLSYRSEKQTDWLHDKRNRAEEEDVEDEVNRERK